MNHKITKTYCLEVEDYCEGCKNFNPISYYDALFSDEEVVYAQNDIKCANSDICRRMYERMKKEASNNE